MNDDFLKKYKIKTLNKYNLWNCFSNLQWELIQYGFQV